MTAIAVVDETLLSAENLKNLRAILDDEVGLEHRCKPYHIYRVVISVAGIPTGDGVHQPVIRDEYFVDRQLSDNVRERVATIVEDFVNECLPDEYEECTCVVECIPIIKNTKPSKKRVFRDGDTDKDGYKVRRAVTTSPVCIDLTGDDKPEDKGMLVCHRCGTVVIPFDA